MIHILRQQKLQNSSLHLPLLTNGLLLSQMPTQANRYFYPLSFQTMAASFSATSCTDVFLHVNSLLHLFCVLTMLSDTCIVREDFEKFLLAALVISYSGIAAYIAFSVLFSSCTIPAICLR